METSVYEVRIPFVSLVDSNQFFHLRTDAVLVATTRGRARAREARTAGAAVAALAAPAPRAPAVA